MAKSLSVYRRKANLVDLFLISRPGAASYLFKAATNFDTALVDIQIVPQHGFRSRNAFDSGPAEGFRDRTRFTFNPSDYALDDTKPIWLRIQQNNVDGTSEAVEALHLILPYNPQGRHAIVLTGSAPIGATLANSLELNLQYQCQSIELQNNGGNDIHVAFEPGGPEFLVRPLAVGFTNLVMTYPIISQLFVRANGGASLFSAVMAARNESV